MKDAKDYPNTAGLDADKLELLAYLLEDEGVEAEPTLRPIPRRESRQELPLSFAQQRLWFLNQLQPDTAAYNMPGRVRLNGRLDIAALEACINEILRRHESLRTTFYERDGIPMQVVSPSVHLTLPVADLSVLDPSAREAELGRRSMEESQRPFNLADGPLLRGTLLRLSADEHVLLLTMHHIVSDGWSSAILIREVATLYEAYSTGQESPLAELTIQYADYAVWQREWLRGEALDAQLSYWREQLGGELPVLQLPLDNPRPSVQKFSGAVCSAKIPEGVHAQLDALSRREGATLYMTLLAAFQLLLSRYSNQTDILVGTPVANRTRQESEALIGFFVNTLVMRTELGGNPSFRELVGRVRGVALGAYAHQEVPFEKLVEEMGPERSLSYSPMFQVVFAFHNAPLPEVEANGLRMTPMPTVGMSSKFDLALEMEATADGLVAHFLYRTELFEAATIERMAGHFLSLLAAVASDPNERIAELPLLTTEERRRLLYDWNDTGTEYPSSLCLHQLFERQVEKTPDSVALIYEDEELTYTELNGRANRLAHHLRSLGVGAEMRVGILMERSPEMVVALLGVIKAGGAYVPLDPAYPQERIRFMLEDSEVSLLLTQERLLEEGAVQSGTRVLCLDAGAGAWAQESAENPANMAEPDNIVYVMYTSGSTGRPKGVAVNHRGVVNALYWLQAAFSLDESDCLLLKASLGFDVSVWETFTGWFVGARVVVARHGAQQDSAYLVRTVARYGVTTVQFVPSLLPMFLEESGLDEAVVSLKRMAVGGEAMPVELLERLRSRLSIKVHDWYGPTEGSIGSIHWPDAGEPLRFAVPIGRPIDNTTAYILDAHMQPVPVGVAGELYLGGTCVARGYWNRPNLTAERFIPDPFSAEGGARLYRTGDLTRYLPDGRIEYLGRLDHQVKIRGLRIELEEIEAALGSQEGVGECVVLAREDAAGDKRLVAYIVTARGSSPPSSTELRRHLREQLPDYMIPSAFMLLDELPLTSSGKVDRRALPAPDAAGDDSEGYVAPRTPTEEMVAGIWAEVLGVGRVGAEANFFELGGHSLLATQVVSRLRDAFCIELPLSRFFESPVLAELSSAIEAEVRAGRGVAAPALRPASREGSLPLSFAQQRLWFIDQLEPGNPVYNTPGGVRLEGALDLEALERTFTELIRRHESLRTAFHGLQGEPVQVINNADTFNIRLEDLSLLKETEREAKARALTLEETQLPFDLSRGTLIRARLLRFGAESHTLLVTMHHIISDGWSMGVLIREVATLYEAYSTGQESPLAELTIQYADYAVWQREWLRGEALDAQLSYWREQLAGAPTVLELPTDRPRPKVQTFRGASLPFSLPKGLTEGLKTLSRLEGSTLFMTLLAALQTLLKRHTGQDDILTGTPVANRQRAELENLIGFFANTLVMRTDLSGDPTFRELLRRVREVALGAYNHQDVPFELLVEELQPERSLSYTPLFQVLFVLQNAPAETVGLQGLTASTIEVESGTAKFDLMLSLEETAEGLAGVCEYSTDLFDEATVRRTLGQLRTLLESIVANPEERISALPLLTEAERRELFEWNETASEFPRETCIHALVAEQAALAPESTAVVFEDARLSYGELDERANRLAHHLRALGVVAETVVAVMLERSIEMMVGVLGVLKAGGAYLPLDPEYPQERIAFMLEDARAHVILTEQKLIRRLPEHRAHVVCLDADRELIERESARELEHNVSALNPAYVIYTSGSTGKPKAVVMSHRAASNLITYQMRSSGAARRARTLQFASLSFDVSFQEIFSTWAAGATLVLLREEERRDGAAMLRVLVEQRVERLFLPFVALQHLAEVSEAEGIRPSSLRQIITAGEQLKITPHLARLFDKLDDCMLDNHYGPTETHLVSLWRLEGEAAAWPQLPPIGRPIANAQVYLLDEHLRPVPVGVVGELYVGGEGLARGYLNRPAQTAERFIPNSFSSHSGARIYRTGDLARYLTGGVLEYFGRRDLQVKVRGFRVEIGEVEAVLNLHAGVKQAVVAALEDAEGRKRLAAYFVAARRTSPPATSELRRHLRHHLPDYMIPSAFMLLDELPLTSSGKVDRRALPAPDAAGDGSEGYVAPRTPTEEMVAGIWAEVLGVGRVGAEANFFELGGHSLLATQVVSRLRDAFCVEIPLRRLFECPTPEELARAIETETHAGQQLPAPPPVRPHTREEHPPLSFAQQRLWFLDKLEPASSFYNLPSAVNIRGKLDAASLERSIAEVVRRHEVLRTTFDTVNGQPRQLISGVARFALTNRDLSSLPETERHVEAQRLAGEEAQRPFNLADGPLLRGTLLRLSADEHVLLLTMHHIVSDGWSSAILIREVATLYEAYSTGQESPLEELTIQYADYAVWQREWLRGEALDAQLSYWREQLAGAPPALELPLDFPRPAVQTFNGATETRLLPQPLTEQLHALSRREGATLYMTLLAAFQLLLSRYSNQTDILVGTPVANRTRQESEALIGFFVNTLVMRTELGGNPSFRELVGRVRGVALGAYAHQEVPFEKLVEEMGPERSLSYSPMFQVVFAFQNAPLPDIELLDLHLSVFGAEHETAKFDIALIMQETADGLEATFEYNTDLFEGATIKRMLGHFQTLLEAVVANPDERILDVPLLTTEERRQLLFDWNDTQHEYERELCVHELFERQAARRPDALAVVYEDEELTYAELNRRANRLANHLRRLGVGGEVRVGILLERSSEMVLGVLGVLKAGGAYVPLDPSWPAERIEWIASTLDINCLLTESAQLRAVHDLQWRLPALANVVCLDLEAAVAPPERFDQSSVASLWNHIAERATDSVTAGGFISSYTGEPFTVAEVSEYVERVSRLAAPHLGAGKRVLEIGCGSGLIMFELAPRAGFYVGLDPSDITQSHNRRRIAERGLENVELATGFADQIDSLFDETSFDLIVMASTAQFFPGPRYFTTTLAKALRLLKPGGTILLADIMDARRKQEFRESLLEFQRLHPQAKTRTQLEGELYLDEDFFSDLKAELTQLGEVSALHRSEGFANELGYRYDVILKKEETPTGANRSGVAVRKKNLWTNWHLGAQPESNPSAPVLAENVAYIIFTSGSTGVPKGVVVRHGSVVNLIEWVNKTFDVGAGDRLLFVTSLTFDLSVYDIFGTLAAGATIQVASRRDLREPQRLAQTLFEKPVTFWDSAPVALQQLTRFFSNENQQETNGGPSRRSDALRLVFLSGDWIPLGLPDEVRREFGKARVVSLGGATEASVWSNYFPVASIEPNWASIPYGKPIQNARYHVLDSRLQPTPVGVAGDLYIGGECLALGYTDAALTAERFIPDPFSRERGGRLYMTGDRARYRSSGDIEFLGRRDQQVKIRGYRIELGEIESVLTMHPSVRASVVIVREDASGERRLVGYVVASDNGAARPTTSELYGYLKEKLPEYMIPAAFLLLDALPLTPNGKLDRNALPAPDSSRPALDAAFVAPVTELQRRIAGIWQEVLGLEKIGVRDNFFELGGHSLLLVQMHGRLSEITGEELSIVELFKYPTVAALAERLGTDERQETVARASNLRRGAARREAIRERSKER